MVLVLHERKTRITLMSRLAGKTAGETVAAMMAIFRRLDPRMRSSITFDNDTGFARHTLLRGMLSATTYFCDAYASWQKGGVENANGRIRRWLPRSTDLDAMSEADIQEFAMTINLTPRKCLGFRSPVEAFLSELGNDVEISFARSLRFGLPASHGAHRRERAGSAHHGRELSGADGCLERLPACR